MSPANLYADFMRHIAQTSPSPMGLLIESARGCVLRCSDGNEYLDLLAGIGVSALGHGEPRVLAAIGEQAQRHLHVMVYGELVQETQVRLARRLSELLPRGLDSTYFTNSGTEAVEGALKLARKASGRAGILSFRGAFHGDTLGAVSVGGNPLYRDPFEPLLPGVGFLDFNDFDALDRINDTVAAVIVEPVQAEAGVVLPLPGFLEQLRASCDRHGVLLIFDEVVTGLGRCGKLFAFEHGEAVPDILILAKALGGGLPLGAFIASRELQENFAKDPPLGHVTTFGGHPLSCAAALAALDIIVERDLASRAEHLGAYFAERLRRRLPASKLCELRRQGLLLGLEFDSPATVESFVSECRREKLITGWTLHNDCVVRLAPPLVISEAELDDASLRMERALSRVA